MGLFLTRRCGQAPNLYPEGGAIIERQPDLDTVFIFTAGEDFHVRTGSMHSRDDMMVVIP